MQDGCKYAPMHIIFDVKNPDLKQKARLLVGDMLWIPIITPHINLT